MKRRSFIKEIILLSCAPAIVRAAGTVQQAIAGRAAGQRPSSGVACATQFATFTTGGNQSGFGGIVGYGFTVGLASITACELKLLVKSGNTGNYQVAVFSSSARVAVANCDATGKSEGDYATTSITPVVLSAATSYVIGACYQSGDNFWTQMPVSVAGGVATTSKFQGTGDCNSITDSTGFSDGTAFNAYGGANMTIQ